MRCDPPMIVANWKMNMDMDSARTWCEHMAQNALGEGSQVVVCPSFVHLLFVAGRLVELGFSLGAQDVSTHEKGAHTGQVSAAMLKDALCAYCLVGHSERRACLGESDADVQNKILQLWAQGLTPILCVGETKEEKDAGLTQEVLARQITQGLPRSAKEGTFVIAYEPRWSIGTGVLPTRKDMEDAHAFIRQCLAQHVGFASARVLYGGSVSPQNAGEILAAEGVDGLLIGGASLDAQGFSRIASQGPMVQGARTLEKPTPSLAV